MKKFHYINGYVLQYVPEHVRAFTSEASGHRGYVYEHILVAERYLGRSLAPGEVVHHLNLVRSDNRYSNLLVLHEDQHGKIHGWLDRGAPLVGVTYSGIGDVLERQASLSHTEYPILDIPRCKVCEFPLEKGMQFCSESCVLEDRKASSGIVKHEVTAELLTELRAKHTWKEIAARFGVSGGAVRKWAKQLGV